MHLRSLRPYDEPARPYSAPIPSEMPYRSPAALDLGLGDGDGEPLFSELRLRGIPFVVYSGYPKPASADDVPFIQKPARTDALVDAVGKFLH